MYKNYAMVIGNLTRNPEMKALKNGKKVTNFSIATNRTWKDNKGEKQEATDYHNIVVYGRQAETSAQYLQKGSQVLVEGRMETRSWDDAGSGKKMYRTEVIANNVQFGSRASGQQSKQPSNNGTILPSANDLDPNAFADPENPTQDELDAEISRLQGGGAGAGY